MSATHASNRANSISVLVRTVDPPVWTRELYRAVLLPLPLPLPLPPAEPPLTALLPPLPLPPALAPLVDPPLAEAPASLPLPLLVISLWPAAALSLPPFSAPPLLLLPPLVALLPPLPLPLSDLPVSAWVDAAPVAVTAVGLPALPDDDINWDDSVLPASVADASDVASDPVVVAVSVAVAEDEDEESEKMAWMDSS